MESNRRLNEIRRSTLNKIEKAQRDYRAAFIAAAVVEGVCLAAFLLLMNFQDRLQLLLLIQGFLIYGTLAMGLVTLGNYIRFGVLQVLSAVELLGQDKQSGLRDSMIE